MSKQQGREHEPHMTTLAAPSGTRVEVRAPAVGLWRDAPPEGSLVRPGDSLGRLEVLGVIHRLIAPAQARGIVTAPADHAQRTQARRPVQHGQVMLVLDPEAAPGAVAGGVAQEQSARDAAEGWLFRASMSGRFYSRPGPDAQPFVKVGDEISTGQTVCLIEVMKTFVRVPYGGSGLPERARVREVGPLDDQELSAGDVILVLE
jgi:acetyl-CoA carboxylase biotin carboxyl carrier protein